LYYHNGLFVLTRWEGRKKKKGEEEKVPKSMHERKGLFLCSSDLVGGFPSLDLERRRTCEEKRKEKKSPSFTLERNGPPALTARAKNSKNSCPDFIGKLGGNEEKRVFL